MNKRELAEYLQKQHIEDNIKKIDIAWKINDDQITTTEQIDEEING